ncbi:hypothetical protein GCM10010289_00780 [Streptomyces violascens]|nr:hypothetical protein GCM10010289_00780 [Streptomyces violascens]
MPLGAARNVLIGRRAESDGLEHPEWEAALKAIDEDWNPDWTAEWPRNNAALPELVRDEEGPAEVLPGSPCTGWTWQVAGPAAETRGVGGPGGGAARAPPRGKGSLVAARVDSSVANGQCVHPGVAGSTLSARRYTPVVPSMRSRSRSAWPLWRAYSSIMWT